MKQEATQQWRKPPQESWDFQSEEHVKYQPLATDLTAGRLEPRDSDIEGRFSITKVEPGRIWLQDEDDGENYGPILLTEKVTKLCRVGWIISGAVRKSGNRCVLVEAFQVYP